MIIKIQDKRVDVCDKECASRGCFSLFSDKGVYVQGRGYVSYHKKERWVCGTRHLHGCPTPSICPKCRTLSVRNPGEQCGWCSCSEALVSYPDKSARQEVD